MINESVPFLAEVQKLSKITEEFGVKVHFRLSLGPGQRLHNQLPPSHDTREVCVCGGGGGGGGGGVISWKSR